MVVNYCEVTHNIVENSSFRIGGAILNSGGRGDSSIITIDHCLISENQYLGRGSGGGISIITNEQGNSSLNAVSHCSIFNSAITNNSVTANTLSAHGAGLFLEPDFEFKGYFMLKMENCTVSGNQAISMDPNGSATGAGIQVWVGSSTPDFESKVDISHTTVTNNLSSAQAVTRGGGMHIISNFQFRWFSESKP